MHNGIKLYHLEVVEVDDQPLLRKIIVRHEIFHLRIMMELVEILKKKLLQFQKMNQSQLQILRVLLIQKLQLKYLLSPLLKIKNSNSVRKMNS